MLKKTEHNFVNLQKSYPKVFVFPIHNALNSGASVYDATHRAWSVSDVLQEEPFGIAIGIKDKISQGIFEIKSWHADIKADKKCEFEGIETKETDNLHNIDWSMIIGKAKGYWGFGNYLVIELDGDLQFRFIKGSLDKSWYSLR